MDGGDGLISLGECLKEADMARIDVELERLALDRERIEKEGLERAE